MGQPDGKGLSRRLADRRYAPLVGRAETISVPLPAGLGWDTTNFPVKIQIGTPNVPGLARGGLGTGSFRVSDHPDYVACLAGTTVYVDIVTGNNANSGLSSDAPVKSIWKAQQLLNATTQPGVIRVKGGTTVYERNYNFCIGTSSNVPTVSTLYVAYGGRVTSSTRDFDLTGWALDGTYGNCYVHSGTLGNAPARVLNLAAKDAWGVHPDLIKAVSAANCNATPMSWFYDSGTQKLYVNRSDGLAMTLGSLGTTAILRQQANASFAGSAQCSLFYIGETDIDGFDFEGGGNATTTGCLNYTSSAARGSGKTLIYARNCSFRYAGFANTSQNCNGASLNNFTGLAFFEDCDFSGNATDGFNLHDTLGYGARGLTLNCTGNRNGLPGSVSCNGWTSHDQTLAIDIAGRYGGNAGYDVHSINQAKALLVGTVAERSRGDRMFGGTFAPGEFRASDSTTVWCWGTRAEPTMASEVAYMASETASLHKQATVEVRGMTTIGTGASLTEYTDPTAAWA